MIRFAPPQEPWLHGPGAARIGPVEVVSAPDSVGVRLGLALFCLVMGTPIGVITILLACSIQGAPAPLMVLAIFLVFFLVFATVVWLFVRCATGLWYARRRLLLGERGFLEWSPWGETVILWSELGTVWRVGGGPGWWHRWCVGPVRVALESSTGQRWWLAPFYQITPAFLERLHGQLLRVQLGLPRPATASQEPGLTATLAELSAHRESWHIAPVEYLGSVTGAEPPRTLPSTWSEIDFLLFCVLSFFILLFGGIASFVWPGPRDVSPWWEKTLLFPLALLPGWVIASRLFRRPTKVATELRLVVGAGGLLVWPQFRSPVVVLWTALTEPAQRIATAPAQEQAALLTAVLLEQFRAAGAIIEPAAVIADVDWLVRRYLDEMRLRGAITEEQRSAALRARVREVW